jgi:hypothetical protein
MEQQDRTDAQVFFLDVMSYILNTQRITQTELSNAAKAAYPDGAVRNDTLSKWMGQDRATISFEALFAYLKATGLFWEAFRHALDMMIGRAEDQARQDTESRRKSRDSVMVARDVDDMELALSRMLNTHGEAAATRLAEILNKALAANEAQ